MRMINLTQHPATKEQREAGVVDLPPEAREFLAVRLSFDAIPTADEILAKAEDIAELAHYNGLGSDDGDDSFPQAAMIGGAPWLMCPLERALRARGIKPFYAFSVRESVEKILLDGGVRKTNVFRHAGFIPATPTERRTS